MHIQKRKGSYRIMVSAGFENGVRQFRTATFRPPKGLTQKQEQKAVFEFAESFERKVRGGATVNYTKMTFKRFCYELYYKNHIDSLKPKTASGYKIVIEKRLMPYFGDMLISLFNGLGFFFVFSLL